MLCKGGANLTRAKSGRISFLDVLLAVPPFSEGLLAVYSDIHAHEISLIITFRRHSNDRYF